MCIFCWQFLNNAYVKRIALTLSLSLSWWNVFNATISQSNTAATAIGYCPFLQNPPTNPDVVKEALKICMKSSENLGLSTQWSGRIKQSVR